MPKSITTSNLVEQLRDLGVRAGSVLLVHTSFKAVGPVRGGPIALIAALRTAVGCDGTLVMPTMTDGASPFDPRRTPTTDMGVTAELFWRQRGVLRSSHPGASFAAAGPLAADICRPHPLSPPHGRDSPVGRIWDHGGQLLLLGVTHGENTTVHLAESLAPVPYSVAHPCVVETAQGFRTMLIEETDHCCRNFALVGRWLSERQLQTTGMVGNAQSMLCESRDLVRVVLERLRSNPLTFLCASGSGCEECDRARASVPTSLITTMPLA